MVKFDKPAGWTSFDVVNKVRSTLKHEAGKKVKVGHSGTLDPFATGLLVLAYGSKTKELGELTKLPKTYTATIRLGAKSDTGDIDGKVEEENSPNEPKHAEVEEVLESFLGNSKQIPPAYSAIKVNGKRSYELARKGDAIEHEPREIEITEIKLLKYSYPELRIEVSVSSGTYIRVLAEDIAARLETTAYLTALRRTRIGDFDVEGALKPDAVFEEILKTASA